MPKRKFPKQPEEKDALQRNKNKDDSRFPFRNNASKRMMEQDPLPTGKKSTQNSISSKNKLKTQRQIKTLSVYRSRKNSSPVYLQYMLKEVLKAEGK